MTPARKLHIVAPEPEESPEEALASLVPQLLAAESRVAHLRNAVDQQRRALATKRRVAFIRPEHVRREFGRG